MIFLLVTVLTSGDILLSNFSYAVDAVPNLFTLNHGTVVYRAYAQEPCN